MHKKKLYKSIIYNNLIAFFVFILVISSISFMYLSEVFQDKKNINNVISKTIAENMNSNLIKRIHVLDMVYYYKNSHLDENKTAVNNYLKELTHHEISSLHNDINDEFFTNVEIINKRGQVINSSNNVTLGFSYSEKPFYKYLENSDETIYWSSPSISTTTNKLSTSIAKQFTLNDKTFYIIGYLDLEDLNSSAIETSTEGINISLTDNYGKYIFDTNSKKVDYQEYYENFDALIGANNGNNRNQWYDLLMTDSEIISVTALNDSLDTDHSQSNLVPNWYIIISQSSRNAIGYLFQIFFISLIITGLGFLFSTANSYYFAKRIDNFLFNFNNQISLAILNNYDFTLNDIKYERFKVTANNFKQLMDHVKKQEEALSNLAYKDQLTGLYNRYYLINFLNNQLQLHRETPITFIHIDFKNFKWINDTYTHSVGDECIRIFAKRLKVLLKNANLIARLNGDEFGIVYLKTIKEKELYSIFKSFTQDIKSGIYIKQILIQMEYKGGVSIYPESAKSQNELMQFTDIALEEAKKNSNKIFTYYNDEMRAKLENKNKLIKEVDLAFTKNNFLLYFQPFVSIKNNEIIGFEVLLRLRDSENQIMSPYHFIPILEENGLIIELGYKIIEESFEKLISLEKTFNRPFRMSINISPIQLNSPDFVEKIKRITQAFKINPNNIDFEVTENILIDSYVKTQSILVDLQKLGYNISLDDFGTGYSSLSYLSNLPLNTLKIDRSFMSNLHELKQQQLFKSIISIAENLNLEVIVEGIETEEQLKFVRGFNCEIGQGYHWSKPIPYERLSELFKQ